MRMPRRIHRRFIIIAVALIALVAWVSSAGAQPLADRVPADALLYVGWAGSEHLAPAYAQSHLKGLIDAPPPLRAAPSQGLEGRVEPPPALRRDRPPRRPPPSGPGHDGRRARRCRRP